MASQTQSRLVCLPGELRNNIFSLALRSDAPIVNPYFEPSIRPRHHHVSPIGLGLTQSCRAIRDELDLTPLFKDNSFVFTRVSHVHAFHNNLTQEQMRLVRSVTIDLREAAHSYANDDGNETADIIGNEWLHYLSCNHEHFPGAWCSKLSMINSDLPDLAELVVDLTGWQSPFAGSRKSGWKYLQRLLGKLKGMNSISLKGKCLDSSCWNPKPVPWGLAPWFSPAFSTDDTSLLELLGACVRDAGAGEKKMFAWSIENGVTSLEVNIAPAGAEEQVTVAGFGGKVPEGGAAVWDAFLDFKSKQELVAR